MSQATFISAISNREFPEKERVYGRLIRESIFKLMQEDHPHFQASDSCSMEEVNLYREKYLAQLLEAQLGELNTLEKTVLTSLSEQTTITDKLDEEPQLLTTGQRVADQVATFGGSWTFIISFFVLLLLWITTNVIWFNNKGFDPYPFILLNLILSCIAALQAPIIMMSQNRQEEKDRERSKKDYMINLKAEVEIRMIHDKLDHLIKHQQQELLEIQRLQIEMMQDILKKMKP